MANSKIREAIRNAYVSKRNRNGQGDMLKDDRDAGPRIHMDDVTRTAATPEEFREGMQVEPSRPPVHHEPDMNDEQMTQHALARMTHRPTGRVKRYDELEQKIAQKIRDAETDEEREQARDDLEMMFGERDNRKHRMDRIPKKSSARIRKE